MNRLVNRIAILKAITACVTACSGDDSEATEVLRRRFANGIHKAMHHQNLETNKLLSSELERVMDERDALKRYVTNLEAAHPEITRPRKACTRPSLRLIHGGRASTSAAQ